MKTLIKKVLPLFLIISMMLSEVIPVIAQDTVENPTNPEAATTSEAHVEDSDSAVEGETQEKEANTEAKSDQVSKEADDQDTAKTATVPEEEKAEDTPEKDKEDKREEETKEEEKVNTTVEFIYDFTDMQVKVKLEHPESLPANVELQVIPITDQTGEVEADAKIQSYHDDFRALFEKQKEENLISMFEYLAYDIRFVKDGTEYKPEGKIVLTYHFNNGLLLNNMLSDGANIGLYYLEGLSNESEVQLRTVGDGQKSVQLNQAGTVINEIQFETTDYLQFAVGTNDNAEFEYTYEDENVTAEITTNRLDSEIFGAEMKVTPVVKGELYKETEELLKKDAKDKDTELGGFLAYDISFMKDGEEVEPSRDVNVSLHFKEAVKPNEVETEDISLIHIKEENGTKTLDEVHAEIEQDTDQAVSSTSFVVDSFSVFVLTWKNAGRWNNDGKTEQTLRINVVDQNSEKLLSENADFSIVFHTAEKWPQKSVIDINRSIVEKYGNNASELKGKSFNRAYVKDKKGKETKFETLHLWKNNKNNGWQVKGGNVNGTLDLTDDMEIYFEYINVGELKTIPTISTQSIIDLMVFDYRRNNYSEQILTKTGSSGQGGATLGLVKSELAKNGMPVATAKNRNLDCLFGPNSNYQKSAYTADELFYKDSDGYYYYASNDNFAYYNQETQRFEVYNWIATADYANGSAFSQGNFYPFNPLVQDSSIYSQYGTNGTDAQGRQLHNLTTGTGAKAKNNGFGMKMEFEFIQPADGKVDGQDMIFEFRGDDDVFVFIDGKLALDIGGSHGPIEGSINFATGEVKVAGTNYTSLKKSLGLTGNTLEDWSSHTLKFFYTDRGGASNCKIKFNIVAVPKDSVNIKKEITNINEGSFSDVKFGFKLYIEDEAGTTDYKGEKYKLQTNTGYTLYDTDGATVLDNNAMTDNEGVFYLKHGQMASFKDIVKGKKYFVEEIDVSQNEYDKFEINNTQISDQNGEIIQQTEDSTKFTIRSMPLKVGETALITFQNTCKASNLKELTIKKEMAEEQSTEETFAMQVTVGKQLFQGDYAVYSRESSEAEDTYKAKDGLIVLKAGQRAVIKNIPSQTSFEVVEIDLESDRYFDPVYQVDGAENPNETEKASGILKLDHNATVTVTNKQKLSKLTITKNITGLYDVNGDAVFTFEITCPDGTKLYKTFRFTQENEKETQSFTFEHLPFGTYEVKELDTMRYTCQGTTDRTTILKTVKGETVSYTNDRTYESNYSHTDVIVNKFKVAEDGTINELSQNHLNEKK